MIWKLLFDEQKVILISEKGFGSVKKTSRQNRLENA